MNLTLETPRLWLRTPRMEDAESLFRHYTSKPDVTKFMEWQVHTELKETENFLRRTLASIEQGKDANFVIIPKELGEGIGMLSGHLRGPRIRIGYVLGSAFWNQGIVTEAVLAFMDHFFAQEHIWRIEAVCDVDNIGSARVMEKAGMKLEARLPNYNVTPNYKEGPRDVFLYARLR